MAIYMNIKGISGSVTAKGHENWIELENLQWSVSRAIKTQTGQLSNRNQGIPLFQELEITKLIDSSSADLFSHMASGKAIPQVQIDICYTHSDLTPHVQYVLDNVIISHFSDSVIKEEGEILENLRLNYSKIEKKYIHRNSDNKPTAPKSVAYDLETAAIL